jgi:hypothetical protein
MATGLSVRAMFQLNVQGLEHPFPCRSTEGFSPKYFIGEADHDQNGKQASHSFEVGISLLFVLNS